MKLMIGEFVMHHLIRTLSLLGLLLCCVSVSQATKLKFELEASSSESYSHPHDIVLHPNGELLYVADNGNDRIAVLDAESLEEVGSFAEGEVLEPHDVVFDHEGRLLVADTGHSRIAILEVHGTDGKLVGSIDKGVSRPEGVTVAADGRVLATGARSNNLVVYLNNEIVAVAEGFSSPHDVEIDPQGGIWVADAANDRMVRLNDALEVTRTLSGPDYGFNGPRYLDFDAAGRMYVADKYSNSVKLIDKTGKLTQVLGQDQADKGEGVFDRPEGVEIRGNDIWFSDTYNNRIVRYRVTSPTE